MATSLVSLPPSILDAIFSYNGTSQGALHLWMSGSGALQSHLAAGITRIKLRNHHRHNANRWPSFLSFLRSLRELTIDRDNLPILYNKQIRNEVQKLPPTLRKLRLCISDSRRVLEPSLPSPLESLHRIQSNAVNHEPSKHYWTFATAFPNLESLELDSDDTDWTCHDFRLLPPTITHLALHPVLTSDCVSFL